MNKQLCFKIKNEKLYLEKVLVFFNEIPLFFVCKDEKQQRFLVICTDLEEFNYLISSINLSDLRNMLIQKCTMRNTFLNGEKFWKVLSGNTIENDVCSKLKKKNIDLSLLPNENAFYKKISKEDETYVQQIESEYLKSLNFDDVNITSDSTKFSIENLGASFDSIFDNFSVIEEYFNIGSTVENMTNMAKRLIANEEIVAEPTRQIVYNQGYEDTQTEIVISQKTVVCNDSNNFAA